MAVNEKKRNDSNNIDEEKTRKNFDIEIKNFGPIKSGTMAIKPLTILIGPNQSGKSYAAMLIYSIYKSQERILKDNSLSDTFFNLATIEDKQKITSLFEGIQLNKEIQVSSNLIEKVFSLTYQKVYENKLDEEITRSFASPIKNLIFQQDSGKKVFSFKIYDKKVTNKENETSIIFKNNKIQILKFPNYIVQMKLKIAEVEEDFENKIVDMIKREASSHFKKDIQDFSEKEEKTERDAKYYFAYFFIIGAIRSLIANRYEKCYYLPAARSGILQGHKALFTSIIRLAPYVGENKMEIPTLSGVISDFINSLVIIPTTKGPLYQLARKFENELIYGKITITKQEKFAYPEIGYIFKNTEIPIHRASSTVSELAPIFLYLKYIVKPKNVLIIEEPEAHLHPLNQRILAKLIVQLIRKNVRIIITTHSDYLLEQINNYLLANDLDKKTKLSRYNFESDDFLKPDEVSAHVFRYDANEGNRIIQLKIDRKNGIPLDEFSKVTESLYQESVKIQRELNG